MFKQHGDGMRYFNLVKYYNVPAGAANAKRKLGQGNRSMTQPATKIDLWLLLGLISQLMFFLRFFIQWLASEKKKRSVIPVSFWYFSLFGGLGLFTYAIHTKDPVFIIGQAGGLLIYTRNLTLISKPGNLPPPDKSAV